MAQLVVSVGVGAEVGGMGVGVMTGMVGFGMALAVEVGGMGVLAWEAECGPERLIRTIIRMINAAIPIIVARLFPFLSFGMSSTSH